MYEDQSISPTTKNEQTDLEPIENISIPSIRSLSDVLFHEIVFRSKVRLKNRNTRNDYHGSLAFIPTVRGCVAKQSDSDRASNRYTSNYRNDVRN